MITCTRRFTFDAGHRVLGHEGKCQFLHGHTYAVEVTVRASRRQQQELDRLGRVVDFGVLKSLLGAWLEAAWDHAFLLDMGDQQAHAAVAAINDAQHIYLLPFNPTAENLARYLLDWICPDLLMRHSLQAQRVVVWETPNCWAEAVGHE